MNKTKIVLPLILSFCVFSSQVLAKSLAGGQPGSFLHLGQSARAQGLGNCFVAISDDGSAMYYNPAGLSQLSKYELSTFYAPLWEDTNYNFIGYAHPLEKFGTVGGAIINLTSKSFQKRDDIFSTPTDFNISEKAYFLAYGTNLSNRLSIGATLKSVQKIVDLYSSSAFGIDAGLLYRFVGNKLTVGANFQNLMAPAPKLIEEKDKYPFYSRFGAVYRIEPSKTKWNDKLLLTADVDYSSFLQTKGHFGLEYWFGQNFATRIGRDVNDFFTFGLGFNFSNFSLDYSVLPHTLGVSHRFGVSYRFGYIGEAQYRQEAIKEKVEALAQSGTEFYEAKKYGLALTEWEKALIWDPANKEIQKKIEKVSAELEIIVNRKLIEQHVSKAYVLFEDGKLIDSVEEWKEVLKLDPTNDRAKEFIGKINDKLAKEDVAILKEREKEKEIVAINTFIQTGDNLYDKGRYSEALKEYQKVLKINPQHLSANKKMVDTQFRIKMLAKEHLEKGEQLYQKNDHVTALKEFSLVLRFDPANTVAQDYLEKIRRAEKQTQAAKKIDEKQINQLYYKAADLYLKGKYEDSLNVCDQLLAIDPTNENAEKLVGKVQSVLGLISGK